MNILSILEEMANTPSLEHKVHEVVDRNKFIKTAFEKNNVDDVKKLLSSCKHYANEIAVVRD